MIYESARQKFIRALIAFGLNDGQICELLDSMSDMQLEVGTAGNEQPAPKEEVSPPLDVGEPWSPHNANYQFVARRLVLDVYNNAAKANGDPGILFGDVYVVWFCKTLQNWKALCSTTVPDDTYYEVTYNGNDREAYLDIYRKKENIVVKDLPARVQTR